MTEKPQNQRSRTILIVIVLSVLVVVNGVQWYLSREKEQKNKELLESREMELVATFAKLDSISRQLDEKIKEIDRLGGEVDSLGTIKDQLEKEKYELRVSKNLTQERFNKIKERIEFYETELKAKDEEIARLKVVNEELLGENINLKNEKNELKDEITNLTIQKDELEEKISTASSLRVINIRYKAIDKKGNERDDNEFKVRHLEKIQVLFNLDKNDLAEIGTKRILLRIIDPENSALYNVASGSGTFLYKGNELFYTAMQELLFDNSMQQVVFEYEKGSEFKKGQYTVELYSEGAQIGKNTFIVK